MVHSFNMSFKEGQSCAVDGILTNPPSLLALFLTVAVAGLFSSLSPSTSLLSWQYGIYFDACAAISCLVNSSTPYNAYKLSMMELIELNSIASKR
jgi:hypothetical protein